MNEPGHPTDLQLLNHAEGQPLEAALVVHVDQCPRCLQAVAELRREREAMEPFLRPEERLAAFAARRQQEQERRSHRLLLWATPAIGLACLVALFAVTLPGGDGDDGAGGRGERLKGDGFAVVVYVQRDGEATTATSPVVPATSGDRIRLGVRTPAEGWVTVSGLADGAYVPVPDLTRVPVKPGGEVVLPGSLVLGCDGPSETLRVEFVSAEEAVAAASAEAPGDARSTTIRFACEQP